jgi:hypothetical protein
MVLPLFSALVRIISALCADIELSNLRSNRCGGGPQADKPKIGKLFREREGARFQAPLD